MSAFCLVVFQALGIQLCLDGYIYPSWISVWLEGRAGDTNTKTGEVRHIVNQVVVSVDQCIKVGKEIMDCVGGWLSGCH